MAVSKKYWPRLNMLGTTVQYKRCTPPLLLAASPNMLFTAQLARRSVPICRAIQFSLKKITTSP
jgi:hypothetical protein